MQENVHECTKTRKNREHFLSQTITVIRMVSQLSDTLLTRTS